MIFELLTPVKTQIARWQVRNKSIFKKILDENFTVISNNCWGAEIYQELQTTYKTPFVGMYIYAPDYIKLLKNLKKILKTKLTFTKTSKYLTAQQHYAQKPYPIGILNKDIEIHFIHYATEQEALQKWERRIKRVNWNRLFVEFSDRDEFSEELLRQFDKLPFPNKVCFTHKNYPQIKSSVWISECQNDGKVMDGQLLFIYCKKYFDLTAWLNS